MNSIQRNKLFDMYCSKITDQINNRNIEALKFNISKENSITIYRNGLMHSEGKIAIKEKDKILSYEFYSLDKQLHYLFKKQFEIELLKTHELTLTFS